MNAAVRPLRSVLYIPGSKEQALEKARTLPADAIIFDLEDAVAPDEKAHARSVLVAMLAEGGYGRRMRIVRINALGTDWGRADAEAAADMDCDAVLVPKVEGPGDVAAVRAIVGDRPVWAMMETPRGCLNALAIADAPGAGACGVRHGDERSDEGAGRAGTGGPDAGDDGARLLPDGGEGGGHPLHRRGLQRVPRRGGLARGMRAGARHGDGRKDAGAPVAERQIAAFDEAVAAGQGVAVVDGRIVENLHVASARALLARAGAIAAMEH